MKKSFTKAEKFFMLISLFIVNVLCIVKFFIGFIKQAKFVNELSSSNDITSTDNLTFLKITLIISVVIAILALLISFTILLIKNKSMRGSVVISITTFTILVICFYFIGEFVAGEFFSAEILLEGNTGVIVLEYGYLKKLLFLIVSLIISLVMSIITKSIADEDNQEDLEDNLTNNNSIEEESIMQEIKQLKAKLRIKDLEKEYLSLKAKLDE